MAVLSFGLLAAPLFSSLLFANVVVGLPSAPVVARNGAFTRQGCFSDTTPRMFTADRLANDQMTVEACAAFCSTEPFFGLQYGRRSPSPQTLHRETEADSRSRRMLLRHHGRPGLPENPRRAVQLSLRRKQRPKVRRRHAHGCLHQRRLRPVRSAGYCRRSVPRLLCRRHPPGSPRASPLHDRHDHRQVQHALRGVPVLWHRVRPRVLLRRLRSHRPGPRVRMRQALRRRPQHKVRCRHAPQCLWTRHHPAPRDNQPPDCGRLQLRGMLHRFHRPANPRRATDRRGGHHASVVRHLLCRLHIFWHRERQRVLLRQHAAGVDRQEIRDQLPEALLWRCLVDLR